MLYVGREDDEDHLFASIEELADFTKACARRVQSCERDVASVRALHRAHAKRVDSAHEELRAENERLERLTDTLSAQKLAAEHDAKAAWQAARTAVAARNRWRW